MAGRSEDYVRCSFCNKSQAQVRKLIAGPEGAFICDECIELCADIIDEEYDLSFKQACRRRVRPLGKLEFGERIVPFPFIQTFGKALLIHAQSVYMDTVDTIRYILKKFLVYSVAHVADGDVRP